MSPGHARAGGCRGRGWRKRADRHLDVATGQRAYMPFALCRAPLTMSISYASVRLARVMISYVRASLPCVKKSADAPTYA